MHHTRFSGYDFGATHELSKEQLTALVHLLEQPAQRGEGPLGGRGGVASGDLPGVGRIVVKRYLRGGLLHHVVAKYYLRLGRARPQREFELLDKVRALGVTAPEPVAYATRGLLWYEGWLFMREISEHSRLADPKILELHGAESLVHEVARQMRVLIEHGLLHVDLHPGNILVDREGGVHVVDFDNAHLFRGTQRELRDQYLRRWRRAVIKHALPETLSELMAMELRQVAAAGR